MKKKYVLFLIMVMLCYPNKIFAQRGCCSHHGGVAGCSSNGRQVCNDGTLSPSCTCNGNSNTSQKKAIYGCTDKNAYNYNSKATKDNGSCVAKKYGCTDKKAINYNKLANTKDGSCKYERKEKKLENISYETEYKNGNNIDDVQEKIVQKGKEGQKEVTYKIIVDQKNNVISKEKVEEIIKTKPINEIIEKNSQIEEEPTIEITETSSQVNKKLTNKIDELNTKNNENSSDILCGLWIISLLISLIYFWNNKDGNLLLNKIAKGKVKVIKYFLYIVYVIFIIPTFVDIVIIIKNIIKKFLVKNKI